MLSRASVALVCALVVALWMPAAGARDQMDLVECEAGESPHCTIEVSTSGDVPPTPVASSTEGGPAECRDWLGQVAPCSLPEWGSLGSDGCYWRPDTVYQPPPWTDAPEGEGAWFDVQCLPIGLARYPGTGGGLVWVPAGEAPPLTVPPSVLAAQARNQLRLPSLSIQTSPAGVQLVRLPTWLWIDSSSWLPRSASASVPGMSVTATATPTSVRWSMGDGATVTCSGPGSAWQPGTDPTAGSPDCGHTYTRSSAGAPGGAFQVSATVTWSISWVGGGEAGALPALTTTSSTTLGVAESQGLNTPTAAGG